MKKEKTNIFYEVLYYVGATQEIAVKGDPVVLNFSTEKETFAFYNKHKNDADKHLFWITKRDKNNEFIDEY